MCVNVFRIATLTQTFLFLLGLIKTKMNLATGEGKG